MNAEGTGLRQVTMGGGEGLLDVSHDGKRVLFTRTDSTQGVWSAPIDGGDAVLISPRANGGSFVRGGENVVVAELTEDESGFFQTLIKIFSATDGSELAIFRDLGNASSYQQGPDESLSYQNLSNPQRNVFVMSSGGGAPRQITKFTDGRLTGHLWSPDFRRLAVIRHDGVGENLWVVDANGNNAKQITSFDGEDISVFKWTPDGDRLIVRAGTQIRDMVMMTNFE